MPGGDQLADIGRQRSQMGLAMQQVELAASAPIGKPSWISDLQQSLRQLEASLSQHMVEVQSPRGLYDNIVEQAPRLQRAVEAIREEHHGLIISVRQTLELASSADESTDRNSLRDKAIAVLVAVVRHRQRGADLIYDAYDIDIGGY